MAFNCDNISAHNVKNKNDRTISVSELEDLGDDALGMQLLVESHEATYFGVLQHFLKDQYRTCIWLEKVSIPKSGDKQLIGIKKFFLPNILSIKIVGMDLETQQRLLQEIGADNKNLKSLILKKPACSENMEESDFIDETNFDPQSSKSDLMFSDLIQQIFSDVPSYKFIQRPTELKIIDTNGPEFLEALHEIEMEKVISVCAQGMKLNRSGTLMWLCVSTFNFIYILDVTKINAAVCFKSGLKDILCNANIVKIINDARKLQDYFAHRHGIELCNVFDIQATHIYLYMQEHKNQVPYVIKSLSSLLQEYFGFSSTILSQMFSKIEDESIWLERPLSNALQNRLAFSVMFLKELRQCLLDLILVNMQQLTNVFVNSFNYKTAIDLQRVEECLVPNEIHQLVKPNFQDPKILYSKEKASYR